MGSIGHAIANEIHGHPTDWLLLGLFVIVGISIAGFGLWLQSRRVRLDGEVAKPGSHWNGFSSKRESTNAERAACVGSVGERLEGVLNPLQIEAVRLASDLEAFMNRLGDRPSSPAGSDWDDIYDHAISGKGGQWIVRMQAEYQQEFSPRIKAFIGKLERETGRKNRRLSAYSDHVVDFTNINTVRAQLWKEVLYPLTIDFAGE